MAVITASVEYVAGYLKYGHFEALVEGVELVEFKKMSPEDQKDWIRDNGDLLIDEYDIEDYGDLDNCKIYE